MRTYDFTKNYEKLLTPDIVALLTQIHEYKGEQALFIEAKADRGSPRSGRTAGTLVFVPAPGHSRAHS